MLAANSRRLKLAYSSASMPAVLVMPPIPMPVTSRPAAIVPNPPDTAEIAIPALISSRQARIAGRRPHWSATGETDSAPTAMPTRFIDRSAPSAASLIAHSRLSAEPACASARMS